MPSAKPAQSSSSSGSSSANRSVSSQNTVDVSGLQLEEGDTTTTVAIGQDTYTIGKKRKYVTIEKTAFFGGIRGVIPWTMKVSNKHEMV